MKIKLGLIRQNKKFIQKNQWYHQRFDACPQFILIISWAELKKEPRKFSWGHGLTHWGTFSDDRADWYIDMRDIKRITNKFVQLSKRNSQLSKKIIKKWELDEKQFYNYCHQLDQMDLKQLTDRQLKQAYQQMLQLSINVVSSSSIIDGFALGSDSYLFDQLKRLLIKQDLERQHQRYFAILTAPVHSSFLAESEIQLLKIGQQIARIPALNKFIERARLKDIRKRIQSYPKLYQSLRQHQQAYFWTRNNYVDDNVLTIDFFLKELIALLKGQVDLNKEIKRLVNTPKENKEAKQRLMKQLNLPTDFKNLLIIAEDFTWWQDERKKKTYWYAHYLSLILAEIARRFNFNIQQLKYFNYSELLSLFDKPEKRQITKKEASQRIKFCLWFQKGDLFDQLSGFQARKIRAELLKQDKKQRIDDFRGMAASKGIAQGTVKIIKSAKECYKVNHGDILVAVMTRPDYVPGMKKAAAVVTNEGGVTCHAAIVSRELGIPCVIGTKIATEVLKDGDQVEVNANHGVVTIIK